MYLKWKLRSPLTIKIEESSTISWVVFELNSLEVRSPFLDTRIIEFAYGEVPFHLKSTLTQKKIILKRLAKRILPPDFDRQRKQGFSIPLAKWLEGGDFRQLFYDVLLDSQSIFDRRFVKTILRNQDLGFRNSERLFGLVLFELWRREYNAILWTKEEWVADRRKVLRLFFWCAFSILTASSIKMRLKKC